MVLARMLGVMKQRDTGNRLIANQLLEPIQGQIIHKAPNPERVVALFKKLRAQFDDYPGERYQFTFQLPDQERGQCVSAKVIYRQYEHVLGAIPVFLSQLYVTPTDIRAGGEFMSLGAAEKMEFPEVFFSTSRKGEFASDIVNFGEAQWLSGRFKGLPNIQAPSV